MNDVERKRGRPSNKEIAMKRRLERYRETPDGRRNILTVRNKNPDYFYRWTLDVDHSGFKILARLDDGWEFAPAEDHIGEVGDRYVEKVSDDVSVVRVPANRHGEYYYLMRKDREEYDEVQKIKQKAISEKEHREFFEKAQSSEFYGGGRIDR